MRELTDDPEMPQVVAHEYAPLMDSSDMGPGDWALLAKDIETNYYHFDGFVILMVCITLQETSACHASVRTSHSISRLFVFF
jgi:L-asparaginase